MITSVYDKYFQKSRSFLYPLLGIPKNSDIQPKQTYVSWKDLYSIKDRKLICLFTLESKDLDSLLSKLKEHPLYEENFVRDDGTLVCVFNLKIYEKDFDKFLEGKYSQLSEACKKKIKGYYGEKSVETDYMKTYFYPEKHSKIYSQLLEISEEIVLGIGELCNPYDPIKEDLHLSQQESKI